MPRKRHDVVCGEHDIGPSCEPGLGHDVDRSGLELDQKHIGLECLELQPQCRSIGQVPGDMHDVGAVLGGEVLLQDLDR